MRNKPASDDYLTLLPALGAAISDELRSWEAYVDSLKNTPTYTSILAVGLKDATTKTNAIIHVLETLPNRHATLAASFDDPSMEIVSLPQVCADLLEELHYDTTILPNTAEENTAEAEKTTATPQSAAYTDPGTTMEAEIASADAVTTPQPESAVAAPHLTASFQRLLGGKKFTADVLALETILHDEEQERLQNLKRLKALWRALTEVQADGELGVSEVKVLVAAMEQCGILLNLNGCDEDHS